MTHANAERQARIRDDIRAERHRQHRLWGDQAHLPMGTGDPRSMIAADLARKVCEAATKADDLTFADILTEEVWEALAETDPAKLRAELIQVAAVCVQMVEAIDKKRQTDE